MLPDNGQWKDATGFPPFSSPRTCIQANALVRPSIQADITEEVGSCEEEVRYQVGP